MTELFITDEHSRNLPTVRIKSITLDNFRGVKHGEVVLPCGRSFVPAGTKSDILGIYGQNGSGKTTLVDAVSLLKALLSGGKVSDSFSECVAKGTSSAKAAFCFDFQYPDGRVAQVGYEYEIAAVDKDLTARDEEFEPKSYDDEFPCRLKVIREIIRVSGDIEGASKSFRPCIDTLAEGSPFGPASKARYFYTKSRDTAAELAIQKRLAEMESTSFIFRPQVLDIFIDKGRNESGFVQVLKELSYYAEFFLFVYSNRHFGAISAKVGMPISFRTSMAVVRMTGVQKIPAERCDYMDKRIAGLNLVLNQIIPGLELDCRRIQPTIMKDGSDGFYAEFVTKRDGVEIPLIDESAGVLKLISMVQHLISAYAEKSFTAVVDELDSGIYEYLLGELVSILAESGKGQFIFTSHNLRPLEVLGKESVCFTTANAENRYVRVRNIAATNNLRSVYFREIALGGGQDEELYQGKSRYKIASAMRRAGRINE